MKLKDAARMASFIEAEGSIRLASRVYNGNTSLVRLRVDITNSDLAIINWAKSILEKELGKPVPVYQNTNSGMRTKECYRVELHRLDDVHKILNIVRGYMIGLKKGVADLVVSFLDFRQTLLNENGNLKKEHLERYERAYMELSKKINTIRHTYDRIKPVTTVRDSECSNTQKTQSEHPEKSGELDRNAQVAM